jgi:putative component of membrane protein insertase Oxa1/YidC/SpoIIIJ protein YidD
MGGDLPDRIPPGVSSSLPAHCSHTGKRAIAKHASIRPVLADAGSAFRLAKCSRFVTEAIDGLKSSHRVTSFEMTLSGRATFSLHRSGE